MIFDNFKIACLIRQLYSEESANAHRACKPTEEEIYLLKETAQLILHKFPNTPYACALMSAVWVANIRDNTTISAHLVAGCLDLNGRRMFGNDQTMVNPFLSSNPNWNGHCWVSFGEIIGDISFLRTANAASAPEWLKKLAFESFGGSGGKGKFLMGETTSLLEEHGLKYIPKYIATNDQITSLFHPAIQMMGIQFS